jgi:hypothetical protein
MSEQPEARKPGSISPPGVPTKSGSGLVWLGLLLLVVGSGGVYLRMQKSAPESTEARPAPPPAGPATNDAAKAAAELNDAPPPPPPEEAPAEPAPTPSSEPTKTAGKASAGCSGACQGSETPKLVSALQAKAGQARSCYNRALRLNSTLEGKMTASVRVGPSGAPCSVTITSDTLNDAGVKSCVTQMFRSSEYPAPQGGCVQVNVPLSFVAKH